ncbi:MAG: YceH family protein [Candidatus Sulfotelmatobacter sp.]
MFIAPLGCITIHLVDPLTDIEVRVLGALIEKDITTPDYYPLSLNALVNACNQKNNRDPVMTLGEDSVSDALATLQEKRLAGPASGADSRVTKYEHRLQEVFNFDRREIAILCVLLLRGPQTPGELRSRTERMYRFEALDDIVSTLDRLSQRQPPLAAVLPRQPGTKESRYMQLFSGDAPPVEAAPARAPARSSQDEDRLTHLENEIAELKRELADVQQQLAAFRKQFE